MDAGVRQPGPSGHDCGVSNPSASPSDPSPQQVLVVGPDGETDLQMAVQAPGGPDQGPAAGAEEKSPAELVQRPAKVMRIGTMVKQLLEEVRAAPLDDAARERLATIHTTSIAELSEGLAPELREELARLSLPFGEDARPSDAELRIAQAQLVGWLEGLFHGIQTALFAQQMAAKMQLEQGGRPALQAGPGQPGAPATPLGPTSGTGQYL